MMIVDSPGCPCLLWGGYGSGMAKSTRCFGSNRAGGKYSITPDVANTVGDLTYEEKARLTTALIDQRTQGVECPEVTPQLVEDTKNKRPLSCNKRAERLLQYIASKTVGRSLLEGDYRVGRSLLEGDPSYDPILQGAMAWSESIDKERVLALVERLAQNGWIDNSANSIRVTIEGHNHIETLDPPCRNPIGF